MKPTRRATPIGLPSAGPDDMTEKAESDVAGDPNLATSRATGGNDDQNADDQASTTGTSFTPEYVGRVAGDDVGYAGETGAERQAWASAEVPAAPSDSNDDPAPTGPLNPA
jgi:hypothetical protein